MVRDDKKWPKWQKAEFFGKKRRRNGGHRSEERPTSAPMQAHAVLSAKHRLVPEYALDQHVALLRLARIVSRLLLVAKFTVAKCLLSRSLLSELRRSLAEHDPPS